MGNSSVRAALCVESQNLCFVRKCRGWRVDIPMARKSEQKSIDTLAILAEILAQGVIRLLGPEKELDVARDKSVCPDVLNDAEDTDE
jgi:hypothetical protein